MTQSERLAPLKTAWAGRTAREQILLAGLAVLVAGMLVWFGLLAPTLAWRAEAERAYVAAAEDYETLLAQLAQYQALSSGQDTRIDDREALRTLADRTAREQALAISRVQPLEDGRLGVWLDSVEADALMVWLSLLAREHGVRADRVSLDRDGERVVRAQLTLARAGEG